MKIRDGFNLMKTDVAEYIELVPSFKRSRTLRKFLLEEYQLPTKEESLHSFFEEPNKEDTIVYTYIFDEVSLQRIDELVNMVNSHEIAKNYPHKTNRSAVMRDVLKELNKYCRQHPVTKSKIVKKSFRVPVGTIEKMSAHIPQKERNATIEEFVLEEYEGPIKAASEMKKRVPGGTEVMYVELAEEVYEKLDQYVNEIGQGVKQSAIMRDVLEQMIQKFEKDSPRIMALEENLKHTLRDFKKIADPQDIKNKINKYLKE